ncbi:MAG: hypothetical protein LBG13_01500 [Holosporales bacterium]|jgi:hypothetical protein|nr:hypothetical protein [Holosporales bacterium]
MKKINLLLVTAILSYGTSLCAASDTGDVKMGFNALQSEVPSQEELGNDIMSRALKTFVIKDLPVSSSRETNQQVYSRTPFWTQYAACFGKNKQKSDNKLDVELDRAIVAVQSCTPYTYFPSKPEKSNVEYVIRTLQKLFEEFQNEGYTETHGLLFSITCFSFITDKAKHEEDKVIYNMIGSALESESWKLHLYMMEIALNALQSVRKCPTGRSTSLRCDKTLASEIDGLPYDDDLKSKTIVFLEGIGIAFGELLSEKKIDIKEFWSENVNFFTATLDKLERKKSSK